MIIYACHISRYVIIMLLFAVPIIVVIAVGLGLALIFSIICTVVIVLRYSEKTYVFTSASSCHICLTVPFSTGIVSVAICS